MKGRLSIALAGVVALACEQATAPISTHDVSPERTIALTSTTCLSEPSGLIAWWPAEGNANDREGESDGTEHGGMGYGAGRVGSAFSLDGIDDFVDVGNAPVLQFSDGAFTMMVWINFNTLEHPPGGNTPGTPIHDMSILDKMSAVGLNQDGWRLLKQNDHRFWFCLGGGGSNKCGNSSHTLFSNPIAAGIWYHVAVTKSATEFTMYVNGAQADTRALPGFLDSHSTSMRIGSYSLENAIANALIDEVQIYARDLSASEIQAIYDAGQFGVCSGPPEITVPAALYGVVNRRVTLPLAIAHDGGDGAGPFAWSVNWRWPLNNPTTAGSANTTGDVADVSRTYTAAGSFTARTIVTASTGGADTASTTVQIIEATDVPNAVVTGDTVIDEGQSVLLDGSASTDPNGLTLTYAWRFDDANAGTAATLTRTPLRGSYPFRLIVKNQAALADTATGTVVVNNAAPTANWTHDAPAYENTGSKLSVSGISDAQADLVAGIQIAFDCGSGYGAYSTSRNRNCPGLPDQGTWSRGVRLKDQLEAVREYRDTVIVANRVPAVTGITLTGGGSSWTPKFTIGDAPGDGPWLVRYFVDGVRQGPQQSVAAQGVEVTGPVLTATSGQSIRIRVTDKDGGARAPTTTVP